MKLKSLKMLYKNEDGAVVIIVALMMTVLMGFAALAIDIGFMYNQRRALQNAADAGALSGVIERDLTGDLGNYVEVAKDTVIKNINVPRESIIVTPTSATRVQVKVSQVATKFFSAFLTNSNSSISATAEAEKISWGGDALPFVNLDDEYMIDGTEGGQIEAWEKLKGGVFESIWKDDLEPVNEKDPNWEKTAYFDVFYEDGITVTNGVVTNSDSIGKILEFIYARQYEGSKVYLFSLSNTAIETNTVTAKPKGASDDAYIDMNIVDFKGKSELGEQWTIHPDDLVLLECTFDELRLTGNNPRLVLTVTDSFTLTGGDNPEGYFKPGAGAAYLTN